MAPVVCDVCGVRRAVVLQRHTGRRLCRECFREDIVGRVRREVERWGMIGPGETVLLGLSGGKDSYVLLDALSEIVGPSRLVAVSIVEGIPGYNREGDIEKIRRVAAARGVDVIVTSIREYVGASLYEIYSRARGRGAGHAACTYCGISRRRILALYARLYGAHKVATAHNLDDEAQTAIVNFLRGDWVGMLKTHPLYRSGGEDLVPRIKPLRKVYEWETASYVVLHRYPIQEAECPFINMNPTLRARVRTALRVLEERSPGTLLRMMERLDEELRPLAQAMKPSSLGRCERCGEPTSPKRRLCKLCELLEEAGFQEPIYAIAGRGKRLRLQSPTASPG
ncbi:conserved hypothetical protein [Aeropyrum pernix K1]|uniref:Uncharacterized protein n=1 Tax=Aeropyrum pernix (strain ATCC 700893 / DSM 11879 / JCM 9820 / NBRC 100138 / K1) TaxID=272557 RepID=Q9YEP2_AERPE|nr:TIGR00269 family protein [Aeropyrum pernix]BAA79504.2 conserved hypothetical protein [Aeropyrum pernix K1]